LLINVRKNKRDNQEWTIKVTLDTRHRTKTNKTKHNTEETKKISNMDPNKIGGKPGEKRISSYYKTRRAPLFGKQNDIYI
jgi:hypothetical protein